MVHVTFNEKVECHQYNPTHTEMQPNDRNDDKSRAEDVAVPPSVQAQSGPKYTPEFMKGLRYGPQSQTCPDAVKYSGLRRSATDVPTPIYGKSGKSVFSRPQNYRGQRRNQLQPFFSNNPMNYGGFGRDTLFEPLEPIGSSRYTTQHRDFMNPMAENSGNFAFHRNVVPDRQHPKPSSGSKNANEEDDVPEWIKEGPTSQTDCIELHGFEGPGMQEQHDNHRNDILGYADCNVSGGPTSGTSSNNGSPPAKSTPAKVTFNDSQRTKRPDAGRLANLQNNFDNRQHGVTPLLNEIFKNFSAPQNQSNLRGLTPIVSVQDVESTLLYDRLKFRQMVAQMQQTQNMYRSLLYPMNEPIPTASQVLSEIDKILRTSNDPVYKRPEVRALTKSIVESVIPPINIMNLLKNPMTEPQNRETIQAALKVITQAKQNATKAMKPHTPTESELRAHMDAILQDAIIKKRMENLSNELMKGPYQQQGGRNFPNQSLHPFFRQNDAGRFEGHSQSDTRGQCQSFENGTAQVQENNINRWFSPNVLNKRQFPPIPSEPIRSEELESKIKQSSMGNDNEVKEVK